MPGAQDHPSPSDAVGRADARTRPWLPHYEPGVPDEIDAAGLGTLTEMLRGSVARHGERPALESFRGRMSYNELGRSAEAIASWLQQQGIAPGDRVAIMLPNVMAYVPLLFGTLLAGCVVVNVNPLYTSRELIYQLRDSGARVLFVLENFGHTVADSLPSLALDRIVLVSPGDGLGPRGRLIDFVSRRVRKAVKPFVIAAALPFAQVMAAGRKQAMRPVARAPDDLAFLQYTGGTTGTAKGAALTHRNVGANLAQLEAWVAPSFGKGTDHVMVTALPLYHIFALTVCAMLMLKLGGSQILIANPRDIAGLIKVMRSSRFTLFAGVNTLYAALSAHPERLREVDFSRVRLCISGGMAMQEGTARRWKECTGRTLIEGYGLSETSPLVCSNRVDLTEFSGTIGYPVPSTEISIRDADGHEITDDRPGELCVRGPQLMAGYWQRPDETAKAMTADGYFRTGDIAVLAPDGQVRIVDRMKDMILVSGFNVYPNEVEEVLTSHLGVREAAVIGVPDPHLGESVTAFVVRHDPALTEAALTAWARRSLTGYKVPRRILFREALPKTPVGKVLRRVLRDEMISTPSSAATVP